jgi:hypothetical protein
MRRMMLFLLLAALLPSAALAQNAQPAAPGAGAQGAGAPAATPGGRLEDDPAYKRLSPEAQDWVRTMSSRLDAAVEQHDIDGLEQLKLDVRKHGILGMTLCGHVIDQGTFVDAVSANASGQEAFAIRWLDPRTTVVHSAVFTGAKRCVAVDGDAIDGKVIVRALPNALAVSNQNALTAWESEYWNSPDEQAKGGAPHRGVFIENRFLAELDPRKASAPFSRNLSLRDEKEDFRWEKDRELLTLKPGIALAAAQPPAAKPCPPAQPKGQGVLSAMKRGIQQTVGRQAAKGDAQIARDTGGNADVGLKDDTTAAMKAAGAVQTCAPAAQGQGAKR